MKTRRWRLIAIPALGAMIALVTQFIIGSAQGNAGDMSMDNAATAQLHGSATNGDVAQPQQGFYFTSSGSTSPSTGEQTPAGTLAGTGGPPAGRGGPATIAAFIFVISAFLIVAGRLLSRP